MQARWLIGIDVIRTRNKFPLGISAREFWILESHTTVAGGTFFFSYPSVQWRHVMQSTIAATFRHGQQPGNASSIAFDDSGRSAFNDKRKEIFSSTEQLESQLFDLISWDRRFLSSILQIMAYQIREEECGESRYYKRKNKYQQQRLRVKNEKKQERETERKKKRTWTGMGK